MGKTIQLLGLNFHYTVQGEGAPIILMHGWGCNLTTLQSVEKVAMEKSQGL